MKNNKTDFAEQEKEFFSFHTMELKRQMSANDYMVVKECLFDAVRTGRYITRCFPLKETYSSVKDINRFLVNDEIGINYLDIVKCERKEGYSYWLSIKINPWRMFHPEEHPYVYIADKEARIQCLSVLEKLFKALALEWITSDQFIISRVDYCTNIDLGSKKAAEEYMRLMRKGSYPYKGKRMMEYSESGKRYVPTQNSFTVKSKAFELSIYNKQAQMKAMDTKYSEMEIAEAEGLVRIELRVMRNKIRYDCQKNQVVDLNQFMGLASQIASQSIPRYLKLAYGTGRFIKYEEAVRCVEESNCKGKAKDIMKWILRELTMGNLEVVRQVMSKAEFSQYMKRFGELGISPITIERKAKFEEFENPLYYIYKNNSNHPDKNMCNIEEK